MNERPDADLIHSLEAAHYHPLWDRYKRITPMAPRLRDQAMLWRWRDFESLAERAAREVAIEDVERRAIIMSNPAFNGDTVTTGNLIAAFTILEPGDHAVPHRHTASAIRFSTRAEGAVTIVNGRRCEMHEGDLVLTPALCWHGHINLCDNRTYWFDAANMPLICELEASFFEPGSRQDAAFWEVDEGDERLYEGPGLVAATEQPQADHQPRHSPQHSPKYRYAGIQTRRVLADMPTSSDGQRVLRYVNPLTGGALMPTLDCYAQRLTAGAATRARRVTHHAVYLVVSGEGYSTIGDKRFEWSKHDVFSVPHWTWASHCARGGDADLFQVTDRSVYEALGLLRVEQQ